MQHFYVLILVASLHFFLILLKYRQNNEIRATRPVEIIVMIEVTRMPFQFIP